MNAYPSKLSSRFRTVVPREIREHLGLKPGDTISYRITEAGIIIEKTRAAVDDDQFAAFVEWSSPEDDLAFADL